MTGSKQESTNAAENTRIVLEEELLFCKIMQKSLKEVEFESNSRDLVFQGPDTNVYVSDEELEVLIPIIRRWGANENKTVATSIRTVAGAAQANKQFTPLRDEVMLHAYQSETAVAIQILTCPLPDELDEMEFEVHLGVGADGSATDITTVHIFR
ncbi:Oidioi.mRNA.OKI2018_I69.PAR.g9075.t1.cds [Oikopleura dioica]|uniref:Oidioi.mRNA.OKI2018_I69.PAR.g9075.t1.cds n=1 Tax=Oikopleura dioica TaxID=34765 RepID=A0ABN7RPU4_OIKDI|nr:Oidioi.mRNA.OKI2018_I69.PAR.g9075.t1.cds [Oikopleura dioica]